MPSPEKEDSISQMCQQLTQGLSALTEDPFAQAPMQGSQSSHLVKQHSMPATFHITQPGEFPSRTICQYMVSKWCQ